MAEDSTIPSKRKVSWVEPFVGTLQVPGVETTYNAAHVVEKFFWGLFLALCIVLTAYNVIRVSKEFTEAPVVTKATAVLHQERRPPDMELCLPFDTNYFVGHSEGKCVPFMSLEKMLTNVTASINSTGDFAEALANNNIYARRALVEWIQQYNLIEFYQKLDREALERRSEGLDYWRKKIKDENFTFNEHLEKALLQPTDGIRDWEAINQREDTLFYLALDAHLRSVGITIEYAWGLYTKELLKLFNPRYTVHVGAHNFRRIVRPKQAMRNAVKKTVFAICLRLSLNANVRAYDGEGYVHVIINRAASTPFPHCNSTSSRQPIRPPYITLQPYAHNLALGSYGRLTGVYGRRKVAQLGIRAEFESDPNEGCAKDAPDIDLCHLECRYRFIRDRCSCRPPLIHRGTQTFAGVNKLNLFQYEHLRGQYLDDGMRECNITDYFHGDCYKFHKDGVEDEEDRCRRACKPNCVKTQWEFADEQVFDYGDNTTTELEIEFSYFSYPLFKSELKLTWFNVLSDIGGALGLFLGLSIFSVIHTLLLPLHLFMKKRKVKRKHAVAITDISTLRELHEIQDAKNAELDRTELKENEI